MTEVARLLHPSPVGTLTLLADDAALVAILWPDDRRRPFPGGQSDGADHPVLREAASQLDAYFAGRLARFSLPLAAGGTPFQRAVWDALAAIPFGQTRSYAAIADAVGRPRAFRAVGAACGMNPLCIVVPCHRVLGSGAGLTGFAGGLAAKRFLLEHEGVPLGAAPVRQPALPGLPPAHVPRASSPSPNSRIRPHAPS